MSYDFHLFRLEPGVSAQDTWDARVERGQTGDHDPGPLDEATAALKRRLAAALQDENSALELFSLDYARIAAGGQIGEEAARRRYRQLELNQADDSGIQIVLYDDMATLTVPYWHLGDKAAAVFRDIWQYLAALEHEAGYGIYDPQLERAVNLTHDFFDVVSRYTAMVGQVARMGGENG